jgi:hypothetical protein
VRTARTTILTPSAGRPIAASIDFESECWVLESHGGEPLIIGEDNWNEIAAPHLAFYRGCSARYYPTIGRARQALGGDFGETVHPSPYSEADSPPYRPYQSEGNGGEGVEISAFATPPTAVHGFTISSNPGALAPRLPPSEIRSLAKIPPRSLRKR